MKHESPILRRIIRIGSSKLVTLPPNWDHEYVWLERKDSMILIKPAYFKEEG